MDQVTPRRVISPLKRFNKVAPASPVTYTPNPSSIKNLATDEVDEALKSNSASLLDQSFKFKSSSAEHTEEKECPGSAPTERKGVRGTSRSVPIEPVIIIKSRTPKAEGD